MPDRQNRPNAKRLERFLTHICGAGYSHHTPDLSASRRDAIKAGHGWPSYRELLAAQNFFLDDFHADLVKSCRFLLKYEPLTYRRLKALHLKANRARLLWRIARDLFAQIRSLSIAPDLDVLHTLPQFLAQWNHNIPSSHWDIFGQLEVHGRLEFYLACAWNKQAQANIAAACLREAFRQQDATASKLAFLCAIGWLRLSGNEISRTLRSDKVSSGMTAAMEGDIISGPILSRISNDDIFNLLAGRTVVKNLERPPSSDSPTVVAQRRTKSNKGQPIKAEAGQAASPAKKPRRRRRSPDKAPNG